MIKRPLHEFSQIPCPTADEPAPARPTNRAFKDSTRSAPATQRPSGRSRDSLGRAEFARKSVADSSQKRTSPLDKMECRLGAPQICINCVLVVDLNNADQGTVRSVLRRSAEVVDLLQTMHRCRNAFHSSLELER